MDLAPLVWTNSFEAGKRLQFERFNLVDNQPRSVAATGVGRNVAWAPDDSELVESNSGAPGGEIGYFRGEKGVVLKSQFVASKTSYFHNNVAPSVIIFDGVLRNNTVTCSTGLRGAIILAVGGARASDNEIGPTADESVADLIQTRKRSGSPIVNGNITFKNSAGVKSSPATSATTRN